MNQKRSRRPVLDGISIDSGEANFLLVRDEKPDQHCDKDQIDGQFQRLSGLFHDRKRQRFHLRGRTYIVRNAGASSCAFLGMMDPSS